MLLNTKTGQKFEMQLDDFQKSAWVRGLVVSALDWEGQTLGSCPSSVSNSSFPLLYSLEAAGNWASAPPVRHRARA